MKPVCNIISAIGKEVPILVSVPHCGTLFPSHLKNLYKKEQITPVDDTDFEVDQLYSFAPRMGITMVTANYSRWVIDLNRAPDSTPLYSDGRVITALCPTTNFLGQPIYNDERLVVDQREVKQRVQDYFIPYHTALEQNLARLKNKFGNVLLWDCHSIRQFVPSIHTKKFPDLILGNADGVSAASEITTTVLQSLENKGYSVSQNNPFKGGYITRHYGRPAQHTHAVQLEMTKVNYMDDLEQTYHADRAKKMQLVLTQVFTNLCTLWND